MKDLIWKLPVLLLSVSLFMVGCSEDANDMVPLADVDYEELLDLKTDGVEAEFDELDAEFLAYDNGMRGPCFTLVFPVALVYPDGAQEEASSLEDLKELLKEWKANSLPGDGRPHLAFPYEVETDDGEIVTVESREDLMGLKKDCVRDNKRRLLKRCFDLVYPVVIELPNGDELEIEDQAAMKKFLHRWVRAHRGHLVRPKVQLPFDVETRDGEIITINSKEDLIQALKDCRG